MRASILWMVDAIIFSFFMWTPVKPLVEICHTQIREYCDLLSIS